VKAAKEDQRTTKQRKCSAPAQARATANMVATSFKKAKIIEDTLGLALFTMLGTCGDVEAVACVPSNALGRGDGAS
jgi:hypothetical protein